MSDIVPSIVDPSKPHICPLGKKPITCDCPTCERAKAFASSRASLARAYARSVLPPRILSAPEPTAPRETTRQKYERQRRERYEQLEKTTAYLKAEYSKPKVNVNSIVTNGVFVWIETQGTGHVLLTVHESSITMFSYGRYDDIYPNTLGAKGECVLIKANGKDCLPYLKAQLYEKGAKVFKITDVNNGDVFDYLNNSWDLSNNLPDSTTSELIKDHGRVVDTYDLTGNNCTTKIVDALKYSGSNIFDTSMFGIDYEEDFTIPVSIRKYLEKSASSFDMVVIDVTQYMQEYIKNTTTLVLNELSKKDIIYASGASSASTIGSSSGYSGATVGGFLSDID